MQQTNYAKSHRCDAVLLAAEDGLQQLPPDNQAGLQPPAPGQMVVWDFEQQGQGSLQPEVTEHELAKRQRVHLPGTQPDESQGFGRLPTAPLQQTPQTQQQQTQGATETVKVRGMHGKLLLKVG